MKKVLLLITLCFALVQPVQATELPTDLDDALPDEALELLQETERDQWGIPDLNQGIAKLLEKGCAVVGELFQQELGGVVLLLCVVLVCALTQECLQTAGKETLLDLVPLAGGTAVVLMTAGDLRAMIGLGTQTVEELNIFSKALLPTLTAAVAAGGGAVSAGIRHVAAVYFADIFLTLIRDILLPMVYLYMAAVTADLLLPGHRLQTIAAAIKKATVWLLTGGLAIYIGYLSLTGVSAGSIDTLSVQLTRSALGALPVVGSIISEAAGAVLSGAAVLKSTIGITGMLAVLAMCLMPFLHLAVQYLAYKAAAFLAGVIGTSPLVTLIDHLGGAFGLVLGMTGASATLLLISIMSSVMVVTA